ncbi:TatD family hydrolase [Paenibacillus alkalitolerans]|uniref:TatD family hydrolase n=1 Tax=Paenibacillus alkalitolerans TaxID=2799335 RepID=UPI0018F3FA82|nr:TatD family hydrolase [Paenibacillus alkalitolerans]
MRRRAIDTHIHLDGYDESRCESVLDGLREEGIDAVVAVSMGLESCGKTLSLARRYPDRVLPAFGFHPEQPIPPDGGAERLFRWLEEHRSEVKAIGEVGLPYFSRMEAAAAGRTFDIAPYVRLLERFVALAAQWNVPLALHAVHDDAPIVCDLLEKHGVTKAHFHWFKGDERTLSRMMDAGYYVSVTPECVYDAETQAVIRRYPLSLLLTETDGPWPFEGPFAGQETHPRMVHHVVECIARMKEVSVFEAQERLYANAKQLYGL